MAGSSNFNVRCKEKEEAAEVNYLELTNELRDKLKCINLYIITFDGNPLSNQSSDEDLRFYLDKRMLSKFDDIKIAQLRVNVSGSRNHYFRKPDWFRSCKPIET